MLTSVSRAPHQNAEGAAPKTSKSQDGAADVNPVWTGLALQTKLAVGASNDPLEQEADRVADHVLAAPGHPAVSGAPPRIQRLTTQPSTSAEAAPASVGRVLASAGRPLEPAVRQDMERRFSHDFRHVRVHSGAAAEESARDVNAHAYTAGHNIVFGASSFAPGTSEGRRLIAHELTHVVQQSDGISSPHTIQRQYGAGCATCLTASAAGSKAHPYAQQLFVTAYGRDIVAEAPILDNPFDDDGRLDLFRVDMHSRPKLIEYGEIKPDNDAGRKQGRKDLAWYGEQAKRPKERPRRWTSGRTCAAARTAAAAAREGSTGSPIRINLRMSPP